MELGVLGSGGLSFWREGHFDLRYFSMDVAARDGGRCLSFGCKVTFGLKGGRGVLNLCRFSNGDGK